MKVCDRCQRPPNEHFSGRMTSDEIEHWIHDELVCELFRGDVVLVDA